MSTALAMVFCVVGVTKSSAAFVANPGAVDSTITGGFLRVANNSVLPDVFLDDLGDEPLTVSGNIAADGSFAVPDFAFPEYPFELTDPIAATLGVTIMGAHKADGKPPIFGTIDPVTGIANLTIRIKIKARTIAGGSIANIGNNCFLGTDAAPIELVTSTENAGVPGTFPDPENPEGPDIPGTSPGGVRYDMGTGTLRVADSTFSVPGNTGCQNPGFGLVNINEVIGIPAASGNHGELAFKLVPAPISNATITIGAKPANITNQTNANFNFTSNVPSGLDYQCQLDGGSWTACNSMSASYTSLADGPHTFNVRAVSGSNVLGTSSHSWTVDTVLPVFTITGGPTGLVNSRAATFNFSSSKTLASMTCLLDGNPVTPCTSPRSFTGLGDGAHSFEVRGTDAAGNQGSSIRNWTVDGTKPTVEFTETPPNPSSTAEVEFKFTASDNMTPNPVTQCQVRNMRLNPPNGQVVQAWTNCTSPNPQVRATGKWRFELRATDLAGNVSDVIAYDWDANTAEPVIDSLIGPSGSFEHNSGGTRSSDAEFEFRAETFDIDGDPIPGTEFSYECWLDGESLGACQPPMTLEDLTGGQPLAEGPHVFEVRPTLVASPPVDGFRTPYHWTVDTVDPTASFDSVPDAHLNSSVAEFALSINGTGSDGTAKCKLDNQNWTDCDSNTAHAVHVADGNHILRMRAVDQAGNESPVVSHEWNTDTQLPTAAINETPLENDKSGKANFVYKTNDNEPGVQAFCQLDDGDEVACGRIGHNYDSIADGERTFTLKVVDAAGNTVERTHTWRGDVTAPALEIIDGPATLTNLTNAAFKFEGSDTGSGIADVSCRIDGGTWAPCENGSVWNFFPGPFASGTHEFEVRVTDHAQNQTTKSRVWEVDREKPDVAIATSIGSTTSTSASMKFVSSSTDVASFECKLDAGAWEACVSPKVYSNLSLGNHVFQVRSIDDAGNRSEEDSTAWTIVAETPTVCPDGQTGTPPDCVTPPDKCPDGQVGTPPNCEQPPPDKCQNGFVGTPPNCKKLLAPIKAPNNNTVTFDGKTLNIRLKCPAGFKPRCAGRAVAVTARGKKARVMSSAVVSNSRAGKWKLVRITIKPAFRQQVMNMATVNRKALIIRQTIKSKGKKKRNVFHTYKVRAKG